MPPRLRNLNDEIIYIRNRLYPGYPMQFRNTAVFRFNENIDDPEGYPGDKVIFEKYWTNQHMVPDPDLPPTHQELVSIWRRIEDAVYNIADDTSHMTPTERRGYIRLIRSGAI